MKSSVAKVVLVMVAMFAVGCVEDEYTKTAPGEEVETTAPTRVDRSSLKAAEPADGVIVDGVFSLRAVVISPLPVEVRFLVDGVEVGVTNEAPYALEMSACDLTPGNHAYAVMVEDLAGQREFVEQFFATAGCE